MEYNKVVRKNPFIKKEIKMVQKFRDFKVSFDKAELEALQAAATFGYRLMAISTPDDGIIWGEWEAVSAEEWDSTYLGKVGFFAPIIHGEMQTEKLMYSHYGFQTLLFEKIHP
jgi:hypothetical protein